MSGSDRALPGTKGEGKYYRIVVRPKGTFIAFRYHDVGKTGHIQRLAGKRASGSWGTQAWLISKTDAHEEKGRLVADTEDAKQLLHSLGSEPKQQKADVWKAKDQRKATSARSL